MGIYIVFVMSLLVHLSVHQLLHQSFVLKPWLSLGSGTGWGYTRATAHLLLFTSFCH